MLAEAKAKLQAEIAACKDDPYVEMIGQYLIQHIAKHSHDAAAIMGEGKTISKSIDEMAKEAMKKKRGNRAMLTDPEGYAIVLKYFGIENDPAPVSYGSNTTGLSVSVDDYL